MKFFIKEIICREIQELADLQEKIRGFGGKIAKCELRHAVAGVYGYKITYYAQEALV